MIPSVIAHVAAEETSVPSLSLERDLAEIETLLITNRRLAKNHRAKATPDDQGVDLEKKRIEKYVESFLRHYPDAMAFSWGLEKMQRKVRRLRRIDGAA